MDANILGLGLLGAVGIYFSYLGMNAPKVIPINPTTPWGEQVGKTHAIQSMHGDASMSTELLRRRTIQAVGRLKPRFIKESRTQLGTITGAIETFMISGICPNLCIPTCPGDIIFDGGNQTSDFCPIPGSADYDAGTQNTKVCGV